ncbi:MAG: OpgC domain-containing protein [Rhodovarius sp.]|nr:OpgC domain-containing protein [Rhodovarius sp.]MCX7932404.1 OpgC domain-containing protein [Rhodovarius sp.]MDW8315125.1 OpgC domain-containing protein [Rhodovarius sp.]
MQHLIRGARDLRADIFRGVALWFIFINHIPGNWAGWFTTRNYSFADATEVFVFLAGYAGGIAYGKLMEREGWFFAASRVIGRVGTLYVAHIFLFVVFTAQVGFSAATLDRAIYLDELEMDPLGSDPYTAMLMALLLLYQPAFLNILPLYIVLLLLFALALPLIGRPWLLLGLSFALYVLVRALGINLPSWTGGGWFFNPLAWQLLFVCGVVIGYAPPGRAALALPRRRWLIALALAFLIPSAAVMLAAWHAPQLLAEIPGPWTALLQSVDKAGLHPLRLLSLLAMAYLVVCYVPRDAAWLRSSWAQPLVLMGQQALPVFCVGIFLSFLGRIALEKSDGFAMQAAVNILGFLVLFGVAVIAAWYGQKVRGGRAAGAAQPLPAAMRTDTA